MAARLIARIGATAHMLVCVAPQILGDFKKVTGFGKKAGYVPPPKIPSM